MRRALIATAIVVAWGYSLISCLETPKPCAPQAQIEADYLEQLLEQCKGYTVATCPAAPALKAPRAAEESDAGCRY